MTVVARKLAACPVRTAAEVWRKVCAMLAPEGGAARGEMESASGIAASLIADECPKNSPIVMVWSGPRVRIYCVYGDEASDPDALDERELAFRPATEDWELWLPCPAEDLQWVSRELKKKSSRLRAYDLKKGPDETGESEGNKSGAETFSFGKDAFGP